MAANNIYRWRVAVQEDGTYAHLYINQCDFTGFGGITVTDHRVCLGSLEGSLTSDNPGERGLYLYALLQTDDDYGYYEDDSQGRDRDRIRDYWHKLGKPTADCHAPNVDVEWFPWAQAGFTPQEALRTIIAEYSGCGWACTRSNVIEKLAALGVSAAETDAVRAAVEAERNAAHAEWVHQHPVVMKAATDADIDEALTSIPPREVGWDDRRVGWWLDSIDGGDPERWVE
jgi:hypothetical protein